MAFYPMHARRFSRDSVLRRHRRLWAWVANCYRLAGFDDDRCILEGSKAVTHYQKLYDAGNRFEVIPRDSGMGPGTTRSKAIPSSVRARALLDRLAAPHRKGPPTPPAGTASSGDGPTHNGHTPPYPASRKDPP